MNTTPQNSKLIRIVLFVLLFGVFGQMSLYSQNTYPEGAINGVFSVGENTTVYFSQGNLQYQASTNTWQFAEHQYDYVGNDNSNISQTNSGWIDLFGWGTSGYNHGANCYQAWSTSTTNSDYYAYGSYSYNLFDQTGQADWGYNAISNGGNHENSGWRTLTHEEWSYLFYTRSTSSGIRYAKAQVNDINGVILLPDDWSTSYYALNSTDTYDASFSRNVITAAQWTILELHGAVFLPAAGLRDGTSVNGVGSSGYYWSASYSYSYNVWFVHFFDSYLLADYYSNRRKDGQSVRLVRFAQGYSCVIDPTPSPVEGGVVSGSGTYEAGAECTLMATPSAGYTFAYWTQNGRVVSSDASYTFTVGNNRDLVANFSLDNTMGCLNGLFSTGENSSVMFSQGNLQYLASNNTWRFAENQWDYVGSDNRNASSTYSSLIDLFGWSTSGYNHGAYCYQPWSTSYWNGDYYAYGSYNYNLFDQTGQAEWGYNVISNGGNHENSGWRTLTHEEWSYLFNSRNTASGIRCAKACVNNVNGVILLPDDWSADYYMLNDPNGGNYLSNVITADQWNILEQHGAVFLPAAGYRRETSVNYVGSYGYYWSASYSGSSYAWDVYFDGSYLSSTNVTRFNGQSVRLVRDYSCVIDAIPIPSEGGAVSGSGAYEVGTECTLTATASVCYHFLNWTVNGEVVSEDAVYTFTVGNNRTLVAHFVLQSNTPEGAIGGVFSVSENTAVYFSQGNLQYQASTNTWQFAEHQYDYVGNANRNISQTNSGWIDLFGWGTSGYNHGANCYQPWSTSTSSSDYYAYGSYNYDLYDQTGQADWGYNAISNGGNHENSGWRTLTIWEWEYLFHTRSTSSGIRYAKAQVNGINGVILLPDDWSTSYYALNSTNIYNASFTSNTITATQWTTLEQLGAVFLPAAGYRCGTSVYNGGSGGYYWSASHSDGYFAGRVGFGDSGRSTFSNFYREYGQSVRLVRIVPGYSFVIDAIPSPVEGGVVSGAGAYKACTECTLTATANEGYTFVNWTENGEEVSTEADYFFIVEGDRTLEANFFTVSYEITITSSPSEGGLVTGVGSYYYGEECTLTAMANEGYVFLYWSENGTVISDNADYSFVVTGDRDLEAHFAEEGSVCNLIISLYDSCGDGWEGNKLVVGRGDETSEEITLGSGSSGEQALTVINGDHITLTWIYGNFIGECSFIVSYSNGNLICYGENMSSDFSFEFDVDCEDMPETVLIVTASAEPSEGGTVSGAGSYGYNATCILTAAANEGYDFMYWTLNDVQITSDADYSFNVTEDCEFVAHFTPSLTIITATSSPTEGGTIDGDGTYEWRSTCTLTATPNEGYVFVNWTENGDEVSAAATYTFTVEGDRTLMANFALPSNIPAGALTGFFSVSEGQQVQFSQGNLRYQASTNTWRFAEKQWDYVGEGNNNISATYDGWTDLFGWGTSGFNYGAICYQPWSNSTTYNDYSYDYYSYGQADWGCNAISNGGNTINTWCTPTHEEWSYLFHSRSTSSGIRYAKAQVNGINGVILLPDDWSTSYYALNNTDNYNSNFSSNTITATQWNTLEQHGAVFLPAAGYRYGTSVYSVGSGGCYWSASYSDSYSAWYVDFGDSYLGTDYSDYRYYGQSVRLVRWPQDFSFDIDATPSPAEGGAVSGASAYRAGTECTLRAMPSAGYAFVNWTENGEEVSTYATYTFTVDADRTLVANFALQSNTSAGALNGLFSVSENTQVVFSKGNLQYQASMNIWRFAEHQYDNMGAANIYISQTYNGWIDLFCWGTSGYIHGANCYQPWSTSNTYSNYYAYGSDSYSLYDQTGQADWGYNAISNGGNTTNTWHTPTHEEWSYVFNSRSTSSGIRYAKAQVEGINGVILLPDDWSSSYYTLSNTNQSGASFSSNTISIVQWDTLEQHGAVFLPAAGFRYGSSVYDAGRYGLYWSASCGSSNDARYVGFTDSYLYTDNNLNRNGGHSVRLVRFAQSYSFVIYANSIPSEGGAVSGYGTYEAGTECTLRATPSAGYYFVNWTENGVVVSTDAEYTFMVTGSRSLVANFDVGSINGLFSVSEGQRVKFSQGNLQYRASTNTWRFAEKQWDYVGEGNNNISATYDGWIDLFGWGTSGYNHGATCYQPWSTSSAYGNYYAYNSGSYNLFDQTGQAEWGYNAISNGGNHENSGWRTLTNEEWSYLFNSRNTASGICCAKACVNNVNGVILLPDDWSADYYMLNDPNGGNYLSNVITADQWNILEQHGAVFLPAAGYRRGTSVNYVGSYGNYWSASYNGSDYAWNVGFYDSYLYSGYNGNRCYGLSVRLVRSVQGCSFVIDATPSPAEGGAVSGAGAYEAGAECTLTAMANEGYVFVNWTENGEEVSTDAEYTFMVTGIRNLVANFERTPVTQQVTLSTGWNWFSSYIDPGDPIVLLDMLKEALGDNALEIQSYDDNTEYFDGEWFGGLDDTGITNDQMYMILVANDCTIELEGPVADPANYPITINKGWNWIGFPCNQEVDIVVAFGDFDAEEGDVIQTIDDQTEFDGEDWFGDVETMVPGRGVMYFSNSDEPKVLVIQTGSVVK